MSALFNHAIRYEWTERNPIRFVRHSAKRERALLLDWRERCPYNQEKDYVFTSPGMNGTQPLWPSSAMKKHIRPAAKRAGILKHVRWHVFRHSFAIF